MNINHLREAFSPWIDVVIRDFSKNFLFDYGIDTLAFLHEKIDKEIESVYSSRLKDKNYINSKAEALYTALTYLYNHFCWKMGHQKDVSNVKKSCVKLLSQLIKTGLILSKGYPRSEWVNRNLTAIRLFTGAPELIYEALLLVSCLKSKYHGAYLVILKNVLINEDQECITDPLVYMEVILLFRRLKGLLKKRYSRTCAITLAARIKPPCNLISWLMSLDVKDVNGLKYKTIAKQLMKNKLPETLLKKVRDIALSSYVFKSDINRERYEKALNEPSELFVIDVSSVNDNRSVNHSKKFQQNEVSDNKCKPTNKSISSGKKHKAVNCTLSSKKKKKLSVLNQEQTEDKYFKSGPSAEHEPVIPVSYINNYSNLVAEKEYSESVSENEDYYMGSQSDMSVNAISLKESLSKADKSKNSQKKKQKYKISNRNFISNTATCSKKQEIEIIELSDCDNKPPKDLTHVSEIPKAKKRKSPKDLHSTNIAPDSKKKMTKVFENKMLSLYTEEIKLNDNRALPDYLPFSELSSSNNTNAQCLKNSKPSESLVCKIPSKQNANKALRLTKKPEILSDEALDQHTIPASSTELVADSHASIETKILLESNSEVVCMEIDTEESSPKGAASYDHKISSDFTKEYDAISENADNNNSICEDSDNHLLFTKYPCKETNVKKADLENSVNIELKQSESSFNCTDPVKVPVTNSIDNKLTASVSNSKGTSVDINYHSFVQSNVKDRLSGILVSGNASINENSNNDQNKTLITSEKLTDLNKESFECGSEEKNVLSKYSKISNVQLLKSDTVDKCCKESYVSDDTTVSGRINASSSEKHQHKRKLSDVSNSEDTFIPLIYNSVETESNKHSENIVLQSVCSEVSDELSANEVDSNINSESNLSTETHCLVDRTSREILEEHPQSSFGKHQQEKVSTTTDIQDMSNKSPSESTEADSFSHKSYEIQDSPVQTEIANDNMKSQSKNDKKINSSPEDKKLPGMILSDSNSQDKLENISLSQILKNKHKILDVTNSKSSQNDDNVNEAKFSSEESVKNMCSSELSSIPDSQSKLSNAFEVSEEKKVSSECKHKFPDACNLNISIPQETAENISSVKLEENCITDVSSADLNLQSSAHSSRIDSVKRMLVDEKSMEEEIFEENINKKSPKKSNTSSNIEDQSKISDKISFESSHKSSTIPYLSATTNEEQLENASCASDSNKTTVVENFNNIRNVFEMENEAIQKHEHEKIDDLDSNVKSENSNTVVKSESSKNNFNDNLEGSSANLFQNNEHCKTENKIKMDISINHQNSTEQSVKSLPLNKDLNIPNNFTEIIDNFKAANSEDCVTSATEKNADKALVLSSDNTDVIPENSDKLDNSVNCVTEIASDEVRKDNSIESHMSKLPDNKNKTTVKYISPEIQSQSSKLIISNSDNTNFSGNNSDIIDSSSFVTDSESKFSTKYSSNESIDILHNSDEGEYCKETSIAKGNNIQNISKEALEETLENETKILKQVQFKHDDKFCKISDESSISKDVPSQNFFYTCENKNYLSFSDISLSNKGISIMDSCTESSNKLKNFSFAASTEIFSSYRNYLLPEEDKTSILSCEPEVKDCTSCKSHELSDDEKSKLSSDRSEDECDFGHSNSEGESNEMAEEVEIASVENIPEVPLKTDVDEAANSSKKETVSNDKSVCNVENSVVIDSDLQSEDKCAGKYALNEMSSQKQESVPRQSLRLKNKAKIENEAQYNTAESACKEEDISKKEISEAHSEEVVTKKNVISCNDKDVSAINKTEVPSFAESSTSKISSATQEDQSKSKSKEGTKLHSLPSRRYSLRRKSKKRDDSSKLGIDLSQLHLGSPSRRKPTQADSIIAKLIPEDSDTSEKIDNDSDITLSTKPETRSSVAKALKEESILNTPSYNLRTRKSIIAPGKLKI